LPRTRSSPPARGSSLLTTSVRVARPVVPARAGIFPERSRNDPRVIGRPRPRGDLPRSRQRREQREPSSPPARGSSGIVSPKSAGGSVVPARAGIFPRAGVSRTPSGRRPRPRGDLPEWGRPRDGSGSSSPPARGSSRVGQAARWVRLVVPARAGIFPSGAGRAMGPARRPRPRGDLPRAGQADLWHAESSPPARGSSRTFSTTRRPGGVVPARAGIFPRCFTLETRETCRPRPRGDLPVTAGDSFKLRLSSPPARGS